MSHEPNWRIPVGMLILLAGLFTERSRLVHDFLLGTVIVRTR